MNDQLLETIYDVSLKVRLLRAWENAHTARTAEFSERELLSLELLDSFSPLTETELGKIFGLATSSASELTRKLIEKGVVDRLEKSESDARQRPLQLNRTGKDVLRDVKRASAERYEFLFAGLNESEANLLRKVIEKMTDSVTKRIRLQIFGKYFG